MTPENGHAIPDGRRPQDPPHRRPPDRSVLALLRVGTRGCRLAAALMAVVVGLASQVGNVAVAQAKQTRLYLDAPVVSAERASRAGEVATAYSKPDSPASLEVLAWLEVPVRPVDVSPPPEGATKAFASITARDGKGAGGVIPDNALAAGEVMLAQLEGQPSRQDDEDGGGDLASSEAVRPQLGDGEQASKAPETDNAEEQRLGGTDLPTYAGSSAYAATQGAAGPVEEPSGGSGVVTPAPSPAAEETTDEVPEQAPPTELASASSDAGETPVLDPGTEEETYGPIGPTSDAGQAQTILTPEGTEDASPDGTGDGDEQPYPDESVPAGEPEPAPDALEEEPAGTEPIGEDTGPTSNEGDELALVPVPPPVDEEPSAAEDDFEQAEYQAPVASPNDGGELEEAVYAEPLPSTEAETAPAGPPTSAEGVSETPAESDVPEATSTEALTAEADEERAEIVIGGDEVPAAVPSENETPPEPAPPAEGSPGRKEHGEDASLYGDTRWGLEQEQIPAEEPSGEDTRWGPQAAEDPPADQEPAGDAPLVEEPTDGTSSSGRPIEESREHEPPRVALPEVVSLPEEPPFTDEGVLPEPAPRALPHEDATETPPEGQQPGSDYRPEDPEYAMGAPPGGPGAAQVSQGTGQEEEQRGWDLQQDGPWRDQDRLPETDPTGPVDEQIGRDDGAGGTVPGHARNLFSQTAENASVIQQEQAVVIEEGGSSDGISASELPLVPDARTRVPESLPKAAPQTTAESVAAEPEPWVDTAPTQVTAEERAARQYDEPSRPASARQYDPASQPATVAPASRTDVPTASEPTAPEQAPGQGADLRKSPAGPDTEPKTDQRGGKENK